MQSISKSTDQSILYKCLCRDQTQSGELDNSWWIVLYINTNLLSFVLVQGFQTVGERKVLIKATFEMGSGYGADYGVGTIIYTHNIYDIEICWNRTSINIYLRW